MTCGSSGAAEPGSSARTANISNAKGKQTAAFRLGQAGHACVDCVNTKSMPARVWGHWLPHSCLRPRTNREWAKWACSVRLVVSRCSGRESQSEVGQSTTPSSIMPLRLAGWLGACFLFRCLLAKEFMSRSEQELTFW